MIGKYARPCETMVALQKTTSQFIYWSKGSQDCLRINTWIPRNSHLGNGRYRPALWRMFALQTLKTMENDRGLSKWPTAWGLNNSLFFRFKCVYYVGTLPPNTHPIFSFQLFAEKSFPSDLEREKSQLKVDRESVPNLLISSLNTLPVGHAFVYLSLVVLFRVSVLIYGHPFIKQHLFCKFPTTRPLLLSTKMGNAIH